ncbi:hydroxyethylthiazole kinase [Salmonella enterica subsp. enterica serovar Choleraesuis]|nr:hydroxyethylthiazole kinase [Salmonella enterica subsp. enterica serovar Choleraesuis]
MQPDLLSVAAVNQAQRDLRQHSPLVHCLTNDVVQNFTANVLLALGASPAMVVDPEEAALFSQHADALSVNLGTLTQGQMTTIRAAIGGAREAKKPWALDPVAVGALPLRTRFADELINLQPAAIRGNASEIMALSGSNGLGRGVDSTQSALQALPAAQDLARRTGAVIAVTGEVDYVTDGERTVAVEGGDPLMTRVVGTGCALSAVVAACCALPGDRLLNVAAACAMMSRAGQRAASICQGPGSFVPEFLDALYNSDVEKQQ